MPVIHSFHEAAEADPAPQDAIQTAPQDFSIRLESARTSVNQIFQQDETLSALLDQALGLLEAVAEHPALRDFSAQQRRMDDLEQRLSYGAYPQ